MVITSFYSPDLFADTTTQRSDNSDVISVEETGINGNDVKWHVDINKQNAKLDNQTVQMTLKGHHGIDLNKINESLKADDKKLVITQPDQMVSEYVITLQEIDQAVSFEFESTMTDDKTNDTVELTTTFNNVKVTAKDTYYQKTDLTGELVYKEVPDKVIPPETILSLVNADTKEVVSKQTLTSETTNYIFKEIKTLNDEDEPIQYEVTTEALGNYKTTIEEMNIEQQYLTTEISGEIKNESGKELTIDVVNQGTKETIDSVMVDKDAETYAADQLPLNDEQGQKIVYEVSVPDVEGYDKKINDYDITLTKTEEPTTEEATTEKSTTEEPTVEEVTTEESVTEESTEQSTNEDKPEAAEESTEEPTIETAVETSEKSESKSEPVVKAPVEDSIVYTPPAPSKFSLRSFSLATPAYTLAAVPAYTPADYSYTSNTYNYNSGTFTGTLSGIMSADQTKIDWTMVISNNTNVRYTSNLRNIVVSSYVQYMTSMSISNPYYPYSSTATVTQSSSSAYTSNFYLDPSNTTFKFSTAITPNQNSYSVTIGSIYSNTDYPMNLTGKFTIKEKSATPTVKPVSIIDTSVKGTAAPGAVIKVMNGTTQLGTATADSSGNYSVTISKQTAGTVLSVTSTETNKRVSDPTNVTVSSSMTITSVYSNQTYVTGTAEPGSMVTIKNSMGTVLGSTKASPDGLYFVELYRPLSAGTIITGEAVSTSGTKTATTTVLAAASTGTPGTGVTIIEPSPTYKGLISDMNWDERGLYRNRVPQPVEYNESFQWKAAQPTNISNEYAVDLKTQGRASVTDNPLDIVLVLDNSGSMSDLGSNGYSRWTNLKNSVANFIDEVTKSNASKTVENRTRIGIVNYASEIISTQNFSDNATTIKNGIPLNNQTGNLAGTFTQEGLREGAKMLATSQKKNKILIVMTDGAPTYSYLGLNATDPETITAFDYTNYYKKGTGGDFSLYFNNWTTSYPYEQRAYSINGISVINHGQPTISEAKLIRSANPSFQVFSVGIDTNTATSTLGVKPGDVDNVIKKIASKDSNAYVTNDSAKELPKVLANISQSISNSVSNGIVTDPIGPMYELNLGSNNVFDASDYILTASDPSLLTGVTVTYDSAARTLKLVGLTLGKGEWININYKVKLRVTDDSFVENQWYPMNGKTTLQPTTSSSILREYPVPEARATSPVYSFSFNKLSDANTPLGGAAFELKDAAGKVMTQTSSSNGLVKFDNLKKGTYTLTETAAPSNYSKDPKTYTVVIASNGDIKVDGVLYTGTNVFKVINKKILGSIEVVKHQSGDESKLLAGASFELRDSTGKVINTVTTGTDGKAVFSSLQLGSYTLVETKAPSGYQLKTDPITVQVTNDTKVVIKVANKSNSAILPNTGGPGPLLYLGVGLVMIISSLLFRRKFNAKIDY